MHSKLTARPHRDGQQVKDGERPGRVGVPSDDAEAVGERCNSGVSDRERVAVTEREDRRTVSVADEARVSSMGKVAVVRELDRSEADLD